MGKQVKTNFETLPSLEEVITSESNCQEMLSSWKTIEKDGDYLSKEDSNASNSSISSSLSLDFMEDVSSSSSCSSSSNGPLYQLSDLMEQLPIKRGLSKYYKGKSESFASLSSVESVEDLPKRENQYTKKIKLYKSFCGRLDAKRLTSPKGNILKKPSYKSSYSSSILKRNCSNNIMDSCRIPSIPLHKDF